MAQRIKHLPAVQETCVRSLGWEDPLEKEMATHSSSLAWRIPWTEEPGGYSPWACKESDMTEQLHFLSLSCLKLEINISKEMLILIGRLGLLPACTGWAIS